MELEDGFNEEEEGPSVGEEAADAGVNKARQAAGETTGKKGKKGILLFFLSTLGMEGEMRRAQCQEGASKIFT